MLASSKMERQSGAMGSAELSWNGTDPVSADDFQTLNELFLKAVENHSKPDALLSKSGGAYQGLSSREVLRKVAALAKALEGLGVARDDRVAVLSENRVEWALTDYAALGLGAITVPIYPTLLEPDIELILHDSGPKGVVVSTEAQLQKILSLRPRFPELKFVLLMDCPDRLEGGVMSWKQMIEGPLARAEDAIVSFRAKALRVKPGDTATLIYTSGTMGQPKGVVLTQANIVSNIKACQYLFPLGEQDVGMSLLPLSHIFERMLDYTYFWRGVSIAYPESFEALPENLREVRPTMMAVAPRVLEKVHGKISDVLRQASSGKRKLFQWALGVGTQFFPYRLEGQPAPAGARLKYAIADALVLSKVRELLGGRIKALISGAAPLSRELAEFFFAVGLPVYEGYGLSETSPVISVNYPGHIKLGTVGRVLPGVEVRLGKEAADAEGRAGREILVRGPNVTPGYYHLEEENRDAFVDGWFRTGDLGELDSEGYLIVTGRKKNLFKTSGGKYVSPEKIEGLFQGNAYVSQIMVLGEGMRFIAALIVPNFSRLESYAHSRGIGFKTREELVNRSEIHAFVEQEVEEATRWLAPYEKIRRFALLPDEFTPESGELSAAQKIKRYVVMEHYRDLIEEIYRKSSYPAQTAGPAHG